MPSLKDLRARISSVKSTQKITSAMKMVAASKLKKSQDAVENSKPYSENLESMIANIARHLLEEEAIKQEEIACAGKVAEKERKKERVLPPLLVGNGKDKVHLIVVFTSDRGLCGGFNTSISKTAIETIHNLKGEDKVVKIICVGKKGRDLLKSHFSEDIIQTYEGIARKGASFTEADEIALKILEMFEDKEFDVCTLIYNTFLSAMSQEVTFENIIPLDLPEPEEIDEDEKDRRIRVFGAEAEFEFEPSEQEMLKRILPRNLVVKMFNAILESQASEHGARMTSMDSATRNAGEMIDKLTIKYNRTRQSFITNELIEIISGAEAL